MILRLKQDKFSVELLIKQQQIKQSIRDFTHLLYISHPNHITQSKKSMFSFSIRTITTITLSKFDILEPVQRKQDEFLLVYKGGIEFARIICFQKSHLLIDLLLLLRRITRLDSPLLFQHPLEYLKLFVFRNRGRKSL